MRVLLIEDDRATSQSIELMLKSEGFNIYTTDLGEEGVDLGKLYDYDIILLDLNLPDMPGFDVLKTLRVAKVDTPILILTGNADIDNKVRGLGCGACGAGKVAIRGDVGRVGWLGGHPDLVGPQPARDHMLHKLYEVRRAGSSVNPPRYGTAPSHYTVTSDASTESSAAMMRLCMSGSW